MDRLIRWRERQIIKVVTGVRRCGKSTLFSLYIDYLLEMGVAEEQIISINLEDVDSERLLNYKELYAYVKERLCRDKYTYVFIDEAQNCPQYEKAVDSLFIKKNIDVYITGSNAHMLSGELATLLSGRYVEIRMLPLSFAEYLMFAGSGEGKEKSDFADYLRFGSFPYTATLPRDKTIVRDYIDGIYNTILIKDVATREGITDISVLESIAKFLCGGVGNPISAKKISDTINSSGRRISVNTVERYLRALCDSFLFYKINRFDIKGKQVLKTLGKYYIVDTGLREILTSRSSADLGYLLENVVFLELLRRGNKVNIGKLAEKEVDFVADNAEGLAYYQVSASTLDENTLKRELEPLRRIPDNHPKFLLTLDEIMPNANYDGIRKMNVIDWLLGK
jgi:predicted AAA+ superfamily ATPase